MRDLTARGTLVFTYALSLFSTVHGRSLDFRLLANDIGPSKNVWLGPPKYDEKCTAPVPVIANGRRDLGWSYGHNDSDPFMAFVPEVMQLPESNTKASMDLFIQAEVETARAVVWQNKAKSDQNTAIFEFLGGLAVSAGVRRLCGCTTLVILSRQAYFVAHYWESISFAPDRVWEFKDDEDAFQKTIQTPLVKGSRGYLNPAHGRLTLTKPYFSGDDVRAFLITPSKTYDGKPEGYRWQWDQMKKIIGEILPALDPVKQKARWKEIIYNKLNKNAPQLGSTAAGSVLIKYDPDHPENSGRKKLTLWVEWDQVYNDEWA